MSFEFNKIYGGKNRPEEKNKATNEEIITELRYRIYKLFKHHIHVKHDNNECTSDVVRALKAVCNICMDHIDQKICFGEYSNIYIGNHKLLEFTYKLSKIPIIGTYFSNSLANRIFFEYQFLETLISSAVEISEELKDIPMPNYAKQIKEVREEIILDVNSI